MEKHEWAEDCHEQGIEWETTIVTEGKVVVADVR